MDKRRKRHRATVNVGIEALERAVETIKVFHKYKRGETLTEYEQRIYQKNLDTFNRIKEEEKEVQKQIDAIRASKRLTWRDYAIYINTRTQSKSI